MYKSEGGAAAIEIALDETLWLAQRLADPLRASHANVVEHIGNIYAEGELAEAATCRESRQVHRRFSSDWKSHHLPAIIRNLSRHFTGTSSRTAFGASSIGFS